MTSNAIIVVPAPPSGPTFTPVFTDNFNRADEDPISTNGWTENRNGNLLVLSGNHILSADYASGAHYINSAVVAGNHYAQAAITVTGVTGNSGMGVQIRGGTGSESDKYIACVNEVLVSVFRYVTSVTTLIGSRVVTWVGNDVLKFAAVGDQLTVYQNGVQLGAAITDATLSGGKAGICLISTLTTGTIDDFVSGNVT